MKNNSPAVSIIVPVYNTSRYLKECIESIACQSLANIEIICVDDGSTDNSVDILKNFAAQDRRIAIIRRENKGGGAARNSGMSLALGKYLMFLDSDDFFDSKMVEAMYYEAEKNSSDIVVCGVRLFDDVTSEVKDDRFKFIKEIQSPSCEDVQRDYFSIFRNSVWDKLLKKDFIAANGIKFQESYRSNDILFNYSALFKAKKITMVEDKFIFQRKNQLASCQTSNELYPYDFYKALLALKDYLTQEGIFSVVERCYVNWAAKTCLYNLDSMKNSINKAKAGNKVYDFLKKEGFSKLLIAGRKKSYFFDELTYEKLKSLKKTSLMYVLIKQAAEFVFSVKNQGKYKVITVSGIKIKFLRRKIS